MSRPCRSYSSTVCEKVSPTVTPFHVVPTFAVRLTIPPKTVEITAWLSVPVVVLFGTGASQ
ncbi:MAG: hypothetical protein GY835_24830 [bacterium]|nr:hypothetical protein [bacterium]